MFIQDLQESVRLTFINWRDYSGRVSRKGYWLPYLAMILLSLCVHLIQTFVLPPTFPAYVIMAPLSVAFVPFYSLMARRLHDVNRSGWWLISPLVVWLIPLLIILLPDFFFSFLPDTAAQVVIVGGSVGGFGISIFLICLLCKKGDEGVNEYGSPQPFNQI